MPWRIGTCHHCLPHLGDRRTPPDVEQLHGTLLCTLALCVALLVVCVVAGRELAVNHAGLEQRHAVQALGDLERLGVGDLECRSVGDLERVLRLDEP